MESKLKQYGISEMTTNPQDYISRKDHARICDSRVSAREADLQVSLALSHLLQLDSMYYTCALASCSDGNYDYQD